MRWLGSITHSVDMNLNKLREMVDREPGMLQVMGSQRVGYGYYPYTLLLSSCDSPVPSHPSQMPGTRLPLTLLSTLLPSASEDPFCVKDGQPIPSNM